MPNLFAVVVKAVHSRLAKESVDPLGIGGGRVGSETVIADLTLFRKLCLPGFVPYDFAVAAPQRDQVALELIRAAFRFSRHKIPGVAGHVDVVAVNDRAGRARSRKLRLPHDVLSVAPVERKALRTAGPHASRTAERGP